MKQWVAILVLLWVTATMQTAGKHHAHPCRAEICAAVLTKSGNESRPIDNAPLLATSTLPSSTHLCGAAHDTGKGGRNTETNHVIAAHVPDADIHAHRLDANIISHRSDPISTRATGRYIYFLRRIII